jgi:hypothetical protein
MTEVSSSQRPAILCDLIYSSTDAGHGGRHRSLQLREIVEEAGFESLVMPVDCGVPNLRCYLEGLKSAVRFRIRPGARLAVAAPLGAGTPFVFSMP